MGGVIGNRADAGVTRLFRPFRALWRRLVRRGGRTPTEAQAVASARAALAAWSYLPETLTVQRTETRDGRWIIHGTARHATTRTDVLRITIPFAESTPPALFIVNR
ncbi:hypothetical protein [Actinomadura meridiana]|uniref:hypothetical protein n=1 Tax=Actinomadura meridiana TaxID=559626 RepID=UPI0031E7C9F1